MSVLRGNVCYCICTLIGFLVVQSAYGISPEQAAALAVEFQPQVVVDMFQREEDLSWLEDPVAQMKRKVGDSFRANMGYFELRAPDSEQTYVILFWTIHEEFYWVMIRSSDGKNYELDQQSDFIYGLGFSLNSPSISEVDLDGDGVPEVLFKDGNGFDVIKGLYVHRWSGNKLALISPNTILSAFKPLPFCSTELNSFGYGDVVISDADEDGIAEIIVYPPTLIENVGESPDGRPELGPVPLGETKVYCLEQGEYRFCDSYDAEEGPKLVRGIAAVHPGTIPLSALSGGGNTQLRLFVGTPAGGEYTVDDLDVDSFVHKLSGTKVAFHKRWKNKYNPDLSYANFAWQEMPVRVVGEHQQGAWNVNPSAPAVPGLDQDKVFAFVGPYLELRVPLAPVADRLRWQAEKAFADNPDQTTTWATLAISGTMQDGTRTVIVAIVCIRRTG